nr:hypothetical protein [Desulfuromonadales bacterium]
MTDISYLAVGPVIALTVGVVVILLVAVTVKTDDRVLGLVAAASLLAAFVLGVLQWAEASDDPTTRFNGMVALDPFAAFGAV